CCDDLHAMMDLSDGLSIDAARLARASGVGIAFDRAALITVASDAARNGATDENDLLRRVVGDGEDFELLFAMSPVCAPDVAPLATPITRVGTVTSEPGIRLVAADGTSAPLAPTGWQHFR